GRSPVECWGEKVDWWSQLATESHSGHMVSRCSTASCRDRHDHDASAAGHVCTAHDETTLRSYSCAGHT
ncbi:hypothetical protein A6R68_13922, partial [Neotoma lepida]